MILLNMSSYASILREIFIVDQVPWCLLETYAKNHEWRTKLGVDMNLKLIWQISKIYVHYIKPFRACDFNV